MDKPKHVLKNVTQWLGWSIFGLRQPQHFF